MAQSYPHGPKLAQLTVISPNSIANLHKRSRNFGYQVILFIYVVITYVY